MIDHIHGDYFVDCGFASQSHLRSAFGVWISIYAGVVAYCVRFIFRSRVTARLLSSDVHNRKVSLWVISPAATSSEVFELREMLFRAIRRGHFSFVMVSLFCIAAAILSAAATTIANHTVVKNVVVRKTVVPGRLSWRDVSPLGGLDARVASRVKALDQAKAPLDQLFDFVPDDNTNWAFVRKEWNNTWLGKCDFYKYADVDLEVLSTPFLFYQDVLPGLGTVLPPWATLDKTQQGFRLIVASHDTNTKNDTGAYRDLLFNYAFGTAPDAGGDSVSTTNISFANVLVHNIGRGNGTIFMDTQFRSDIHVAECSFNNSSPNVDQARADNGQYNNSINAVMGVYTTRLAEASTLGQTVVQPSAEEMVRNWQAYQMVNSGFYIHPVNRTISTSLEIVQVRLSVLIATFSTFILAIAAAGLARCSEPLDEHGQHMTLPRSPLAWIVEAARQRHGESNHQSHRDFANERDDLFYAVSTAQKGLSRTQITSNRDDFIAQPFLGFVDPNSPFDNSRGISAPTQGDEQYPLNHIAGDFDPYSLYDKTEAESMLSTPARSWREQ